ncbi:unnamed protein product [Rotaria sordida]|uniref:WSC domain-containing protein n=1 Tax=Rotaria sordida TaxID=392033 RepID=A0A814ILK1_9BILA|nr:unnamed protein product [Rotaria sordida]CAF1206749.1 unnamed protein product [Rotaria sordida]
MIHPIYSSYQYAGCYTQVFHESFFISSFMEPKLCFHLCNTPIIYLQLLTCRCSGGGLMHYNRQKDQICNIKCTQLTRSQIKTNDTCGGTRVFSAYVEENFYTQHGHLLNYQIHFSSCELWTNSGFYNTLQVTFDKSSIKSSLNKMERCAAACLDENTMTKSIAFNDDNNQCLCILSQQSYLTFTSSRYLTILPNNSCNRYCDNTLDNSKIEQKFQCGSSTNRRIWAIYDLNGSCPINYVYIKELQKCVYAYKTFWSSCITPSKVYIYDGNITWNIFLKIIEKLNLNKSIVTIDFDDDITIDSSWKCPSGTIDRTYSSYSSLNYNTRYVLDNGCLRIRSYTSYIDRFSYRLCITNPINKYSISDNENENELPFLTSFYTQIKFCPTNWFDLNGRCYRMSNEPKTIQDARNSCITISTSESNNNDKAHFWFIDDDDNDNNEVHDSPKSNIASYTSHWQARLGFFLLDKPPDNDELKNESTVLDLNIYRSSINEFQMMNPTEKNNSNEIDNSCILATRTIIKENETPIINTTEKNDCSKPQHVLCETKTLIVHNFQQRCFRKPLILDLPAFISKHLTYELCLTICQGLQTKLAIININKCYCLNGFTSKVFNLTKYRAEYLQENCGDPCPGNVHERCGDKNTIVVFHVVDVRRIYSLMRIPMDSYPDFVYDSCIYVSSFNSSTTYQFNLNNVHNIHPRHCLQLCTNYQQKYAFINSNLCLCTNIPLKDTQYDTTILENQYCSYECSANYFYTCGNKTNSTIYSMYIMQPKCRHGFEVAENDQQCVYSHSSIKKNSFSNAQSYCKSIGGIIAKINDILEIQDILSESTLSRRLSNTLSIFSAFKSYNDSKYFWIDRTSDIINNNTISDRSLGKCSQTSNAIDRNCIVLRYEKTSYSNIIADDQCIAESNLCSLMSATPVCVDQHLEFNSTIIPSITDDDVISVSVNTSIDYSCGNDTEYDFIDEYCYKISFHESSWNEAKSECERDNAMLFVPEKFITLKIIRSLFLRRHHYASSGFAHIGVIYDNQNRTVIRSNITDESILQIVPDSNSIYDLCEQTFHQHYTKINSSKILSKNDQNRLKDQQIGCAYLDLLSDTTPVIRCDEIPCNRQATVICQRPPILKTVIIQAQREVINLPMNNDPSLTSTVPSTDNESNSGWTDLSSQIYTKSIVRDFAPIFFILATIFALILLGLINILHNHYLFQKNNNNNNNRFHTGRRNHNAVYSQLITTNEFDLN